MLSIDIFAIKVLIYARAYLQVPVELYNDVVRLLMESNPETADYILRRRATPGG